MRHNHQSPLFSEASLDSYLRDKIETLDTDIQSLSGQKLMNTDEATLVKEFVDRYTLNAPKLIEDKKIIDAQEADVTVRGNFDFDEGPFNIKGLAITIKIPITGDAELLHLRPTSYTYSMGHQGDVLVQKELLVLTYETAEKQPEKIKQMWQQDLEIINKNLINIERDLANYNSSLQSNVNSMLSKRKKESGNNQSLIDAIKLG